MKGITLICLSLASVSAMASGNVYVMSSGNDAFDTQLMNSLASNGVNATLGVRFANLGASTDLSGFSAVYAQYNYNWSSDGISEAAQQRLIDFLGTGGGIVTNEWVMWRQPSLLLPYMASTYSAYRGSTTATFTEATVDPNIGAGVASQFTFNVTNISGTESYLTEKAGSTVFFRTDYEVNGVAGAGLVGWEAGGGRVFNFSTVMGELDIADPNMSKLLANTLNAAAVPEPGAFAALGLGVLVLLRRRR